jgi:hypothetical protein
MKVNTLSKKWFSILINKEIFICLEGNFDKIWKVSLVNQSIETWRGFASFRREPIPAQGVSGADLAQW